MKKSYKLIKFYTDTCVPCRIMTPVINSVIAEFPMVSYEEINANGNSAIIAFYQVLAVPTLVLLDSSDTLLGRHVGYTNKVDLKSWISETIATAEKEDSLDE